MIQTHDIIDKTVKKRTAKDRIWITKKGLKNEIFLIDNEGENQLKEDLEL